MSIVWHGRYMDGREHPDITLAGNCFLKPSGGWSQALSAIPVAGLIGVLRASDRRIPIRRKSGGVVQGEMLDDELLIEDYEPDLSDEDAKPATMSECSMFLVQHMIDDELFSSLMTPQRLIDYINMDDCHGESYEIFDCMSEFGKVKPLRCKGWQPGCLIEVVDEAGKVVLRGYGEDH